MQWMSEQNMYNIREWGSVLLKEEMKIVAYFQVT